MKKLLLLVIMLLSPIVASAHDIEVKNADGVTIYYKYINNGKELAVSFRGDYYDSYYNEYMGNIVIPDEVTYNNKTRKVTSIDESAFRDCSGLISVTIPNNVTSIDESAFRDCSGLISVTIPNNVTSIGQFAFENCTGLTSVTINNNSIVSNNRRLSSVFGSQVTNYIIGQGVTGIGFWAFDGCSSLTSVTIPNSVTSIGGFAFSGCSGLTSISIPNSVTSIGECAFNGCSSLTSVTVPNNVTSIGRNTFEGCSSLASVTIGNGVSSIGEWAFANCTALTSITIGNSVTSIEQHAFYGCSGIQKVIVSDIATWCGIKFGDHPLHYAGHLYSDENTEIKDLVIPNSVTSIETSAFQNCTSLSSVTIPNSVTTIGGAAFMNCSGLTSITIPNSVTTIGGAAFLSCTGLSFVTIPNSVKSIGKQAFSYSRGLTSITIGNSVTSIEQYAFYECSGLQKVIVSDIAKWCGIKFGDYTANPLYYAGHLYSDENTEIKNLVIPNTVTSIGDYAFNGADISTVISLIEKPFTINGKTSSGRTFTLNTFNNATLYVPIGTINKYKALEGWRDFVFIEEGNPTGINAVEKLQNNNTTIYNLNGVRLPEPKKGINIVNGKKVVMK